MTLHTFPFQKNSRQIDMKMLRLKVFFTEMSDKMASKDTPKGEWFKCIPIFNYTMTASIPNEAAIVTRISWAVESARKLVHGMVVLVMVGGLRRRERHCLCKVVFGRGEAGRENEGAPVQTAHVLRSEASGVCLLGGKLVVYPACEKRRKLLLLCC